MAWTKLNQRSQRLVQRFECLQGLHFPPPFISVEVRRAIHRFPAGINSHQGEMPTVVEAQAEHGVARLEQRLVHAHVGVGTRVRLDVGVVGAEQRLHALDRQRLDVVQQILLGIDRIPDMFRSSVNALGQITTAVLMNRWVGGEDAGEGPPSTAETA